jgi:malate dehydrogenase
MEFLTNEKLVIVGAAGMIGSNMAQTAIMMGLTSNICLYDVFSPEGVAEEMRHCGFGEVTITATTDAKEAFTDAKYIISSGGAPRKEGMTREDLLAGNAGVAKELGENIKKYCPNCKHVVIIFNPADITGLVTLLYSGLKPNQVSTLAALDSTRLQSALAKHFGIQQAAVKNCCTYGGHGEQMAVFASPVTVDDTPLLDIIGTGKAVNGKTLSKEEWAEMKKAVTQGGAAIIKLRGRSSFQSPAYVSVEMIAAAMGGKDFAWPAGTYVNTEKYHHIMMAMPSIITADGTYTKAITGTAEELADLDKSYEHLCALRDQVIGMGVLPAVSEWSKVNPNL